ncbi:MAG: tRNA (adenosine(37)-N6)-threonylcarbamoyltransferase complex ATPase subunit type 1 TsaE [Spirochaetota bacterium]
MNAPIEYKTYSYNQTIDCGRELAGTLKGGEVVILTGELGSGKTVFTKGIAQGLGIDDIVTSPSFTIMSHYRGELDLYHFDFYRLYDASEIDELLEDYLYREDGVVVIEWGEEIMSELNMYILVSFTIFPSFRKISIQRVKH